MKTHHPIITRIKKNPILTRKDVPYPVATVQNAGIVKHKDRYIMLFRSHLLNGRSIIGRADSEDGFSFTVHPKPFLIPSTDTVFAEYEAFGVEDMRISRVENEYLLTYSAYSRHGVRIALARTRDFENVERIALITQADLRNVVIFPEKFGDRYVRLDRPHSEISSWSIWISYSPDLVHWGDSRVIMKPVAYHWDEMKIGPGAPPFKTDKGMALFPRKIGGRYAMLSRQDGENNHIMFSDNIHFWQKSQIIQEPELPWEFMQIGNCGSPLETNEGWIVLTHGVGPMRKYCIGAILLDLENPTKIIARLDEPLLAPHEKEREGYVPNVVYSCGALIHNNELVIPYAMSDINSGIATVVVKDLLNCMHAVD